MVHSLKKHIHMVLLVVFSIGIIITKAHYAYMEQSNVGSAIWIYGWIASAILVGLHESKSVLMDYTHDKTKVPFFIGVINGAVWGLFIIAILLEIIK